MPSFPMQYGLLQAKKKAIKLSKSLILMAF